MRGFLALSCIIAVSFAAPQYNYNQPQYASTNQYTVSSGGNGGNYQFQQIGGGSGSFGSGSLGSGSFGSASFGSGLSGSFSSGNFGNNGGISSANYGNQAALNSFNPAPALPLASSISAIRKNSQSHGKVLPPIITKNIYIHAAGEEPDEEVFEDSSSQQQRKHYNVVFIKAPHQSIKKIAAQTAQALNEEKTAVYVLSKTSDSSEIRQALSDVPHKPTKPEVFFVKYNTLEEAQHAQKTIQSQYDALGGSTQVSDEGQAPVSSVVGALDVRNNAESITGPSGSNVSGGNNSNGNSGSFISGSENSSSSSGIVGASSDNTGAVASSYIPPGQGISGASSDNTGSVSSSYLPPSKV